MDTRANFDIGCKFMLHQVRASMLSSLAPEGSAIPSSSLDSKCYLLQQAFLSYSPASSHQFSSPPQQGQAAAAASCVVDVLQNVKQRVVDETHNVGALEHLLTQQLVLETSIQAFGATLCGTASSSKTQRIADAVKDVVIEAAQKVVAPQVQAALSPAPSGNVAVTHASVSRMSDYTQVAIASAVDKAIKRELPHKRSVESLMLDAKHIIQASPSMISVSSRCLPATNPYPTLLPQYT